jgi:hypothetical protein
MYLNIFRTSNNTNTKPKTSIIYLKSLITERAILVTVPMRNICKHGKQKGELVVPD